jgi:hypothetical protein
MDKGQQVMEKVGKGNDHVKEKFTPKYPAPEERKAFMITNEAP